VHLEEFSIKKVSVRPSVDGLKENYREPYFLFRKFTLGLFINHYQTQNLL